MQEFPFALVSINITRWAVDLLESSKLNTHARKLNSAARACDLFYIGAMYKFFLGWAKKPGSIFDVGVQLSALEKACRKSPGTAIGSANQVLSSAV